MTLPAMRDPLIYITNTARFFGTGLLAVSLYLPVQAFAQTRTPAERVETAALPRVDLTVDRAADLPAPLSAADARTYRLAFQLQARGAFAEADQALRSVGDRLLVGHVLAERYLGPRYRSTPEELAAWLREFADLPDARAIYALASRKLGGRTAGLVRPKTEATFTERASADDLGPSLNRPIPPGKPGMNLGAASLRGRLKDLLGDGKFEAAERLLLARDTAAALSTGEIDHFKAMLAAGWFARGDERQALAFAVPAAARSGSLVPRAHWIAGLAHFRQKDYARAGSHFEALARLDQGQPWDIAAGAFWAARTHLHARRPDRYNEWLAVAAEHPRTFYGLLAARALGVDPGLNWNPPELDAAEIDQLRRSPGANRAFALLQVDQDRRAEAELRRVYAQGGTGITRAILAVAMRGNMPGLSMRLARDIAELDGKRYDGAYYPVPHWQPVGGYDVDPALVFAFMRVESAFNPSAVSPAGARGLMQLMPATAASMDGRSFKGRLDLLLEPDLNVTLGQRYIRHLLEEPTVGGEMVRLAAAYNGGPGNLARWKRLQDNRGEKREDALLFIESLPAAETRHFIARLLYSYWMYAERLGQATPSLDQLAAGEWPIYAPPAALAARAAAPVARESLQPPPAPPVMAPRGETNVAAVPVAAATAAAAAAVVATPAKAPALSKLPPPPRPSPRREARARR